MKKTLIAIAALAATGAFAQSSVTIRGGFDTGLVQYDMKGAKVTGIGSNLSSTSGLFIEGTGDLGGGLKANFLLESDFNTASVGGNTGTTANTVGAAGTAGATATGLTNGTGSTFGNGEVFVALGGGFGNLKLGAMNNNGLAAHGTANPFGTAIGSGFRATSTSAANAGSGALVRNDNTFAYTTPAMFGGLTGQWLARKQQTNSASSGNANFNASFGAQQQSQVSEVALRYNAGPLNAIISRSMEDATNVFSATAGTGAAAAGNKGVLNAIAANYNMGALTVYGGWQGQKSSNGAGVGQRDTTAVNLAAKYVMGVNTFAINLGRLSGAVSAANVAAGASNSATLTGLGYEYALAKNAAITARYERIADNAALGVAATTGYAATAGNQDRTRMGLGIRYNF